MKSETAEKLKNLAMELRIMHDQPLGGTVLLIGGESSTTARGRPAIEELRRQVLLNLNQDLTEELLNAMEIQEQIDRFENVWSNWPNPRKLVEWRQLQKNLQPTKGHSNLALLLKERYFPVLLTSTVDQLIESVFIASAVD